MRFDLIVVGAGLVGTSLARALRGRRLALVEADRAPATPAWNGPFDARVYALSPGNVEFLRALKVWQSISAERLTPVHTMRVAGDHEGSLIEFDAYRAGVPELAWIVEHRELDAALWRALAAQDDLEIVRPAECAALEITDRARLVLEDGRTLEAELIVGADGARSFVRDAAGIPVTELAYEQTAVVANFACERPHRHVALQWFQGGPVLALLPLPGERVSMVWSTRAHEAARLMALDGESLAGEVAAASRHTLGELTLITAPRAFALRRLSVQRMVVPYVALAGDAAHVVHPLAGQGLNLGLQDARALAEVLAHAEPVRQLGDLHLLRRYERMRSEDLLAMRTVVHGLHSLFNADGALVRTVRNLGLNLTDRLPVIKNVLLRHALR